MKLLTTEFNVLNKIATKSKMDCWFYIAEDRDDDVILDCETGEKLSLYDGINMLADGMTSMDDYELTDNEKIIFTTLMYKLEAHRNNQLISREIALGNALIMLEEMWGNDYITHLQILDELGIDENDYEEVVGRTFCEDGSCDLEEENE